MTRNERLERLRKRLVTRRDELTRGGSRGEPLDDGVGDEGDAASRSEMREVGSILAEHHADELGETERALSKFRSGQYGLCEATGAPIPIGRLEALPFARYSVEAQRMIEEGTLDPPVAEDDPWGRGGEDAENDRFRSAE